MEDLEGHGSLDLKLTHEKPGQGALRFGDLLCLQDEGEDEEETA